MKAVILAGGLGTRLSEETHSIPKPMVEIGGKPILWHIMKTYSAHGINDFIICLGYKGYAIKEYFANYFLHTADITIDIKNNEITTHNSHAEPWKITLVDTGANSMTGGRLKRIAPYFSENEDFCFTYGDGVSSIDITKLIEQHRSQKPIATVTTIQPPGRYGAIKFDAHKVTQFEEKPVGDGKWINGGYFVLSSSVFDYIENGDSTIWEKEPMINLAKDGQLHAYIHEGFWHPMDTLRDKNYLEMLWQTNQAEWKIWN